MTRPLNLLRASLTLAAFGLAAAPACGVRVPQGPQGIAPRSGPEAPAPSAVGPGYRLEGEIVAIAFRNINKAHGHFTWNVELRVKVAQLTPRSETTRQPPLPPDQSIDVRVKQSLPHLDLWPEEQEAVAQAPNPQQVSLTAWRGYRVGERVDLAVELFGPNLARPIAR